MQINRRGVSVKSEKGEGIEGCEAGRTSDTGNALAAFVTKTAFPISNRTLYCWYYLRSKITYTEPANRLPINVLIQIHITNGTVMSQIFSCFH